MTLTSLKTALESLELTGRKREAKLRFVRDLDAGAFNLFAEAFPWAWEAIGLDPPPEVVRTASG